MKNTMQIHQTSLQLADLKKRNGSSEYLTKVVELAKKQTSKIAQAFSNMSISCVCMIFYLCFRLFGDNLDN